MSSCLLAAVVRQPPAVAGARGAVAVGIGSALRLEALLPASATMDQPVTIMIRPEDIEISRDAPEPDRNVLPGIVISNSFLGNLVGYCVKMEGLVLHVQTSRAVAFDCGEHVHLSVRAERCIGID